MNTITLDSTNCGSFLGALSSQFTYKPELRKSLDAIYDAAKRSENRYFVLEVGENGRAITRAAQTTLAGAERYMREDFVLVIVEDFDKDNAVYCTLNSWCALDDGHDGPCNSKRPGCKGCADIVRHRASENCESGQHDHCTCDACF